MLILKGAPVSEVRAYMGHATPAITLTVYTPDSKTGGPVYSIAWPRS